MGSAMGVVYRNIAGPHPRCYNLSLATRGHFVWCVGHRGCVHVARGLAAANSAIHAVLFTGFVPEYAPTWQLRFSFPRRPLRAIRVVQTNSGSDSWSIHELQILDGGRPLPRDSAWSLTARPYP